MKCLLSAGSTQQINYPDPNLGICFEQWGNAWQNAGFAAFYRDGVFLMREINNLANECAVLFLELLPKQWAALGALKKPCKAKIFGIAHAPPHNLEVETPRHKAMMIEAWSKCDVLVAMDLGLEYYAPYFAPHAKLVRLPHPVPSLQINLLPKLNPKHVMLFHIMEEGHHDFDNYLTLKVIEHAGFIPLIIIRDDKFEEISYWLRVMGFKDIQMRLPMPHNQFCQLVSQCYAVCQIAGRPSLGRTAADAARVGTLSIASDYWYQRTLFPNLIIKTPQEMTKKLLTLNEYEYNHVINDAHERLNNYSPAAIGEKLLKILDEIKEGK